MLNVPTIIAIIGGLVFLIGLIGGGFEFKEAKMPKMSAMTRMFAMLLGLGFLVIATWLSVLPSDRLLPLFGAVSSVFSRTSSASKPSTVPANTVLVTVASSSTKQKWMERVAANFQASGKKIHTGKKIQIKVNSVSSGGSMTDLLSGKIKPVVWSPGADSWVEQLNQEWQQRTQTTLMEKACEPTIYTPLGFAMWRPMAEALGWPDRPIGWQTIVDLTADSKGWGRYGHPEWGRFYLGHAHPKYGNSGLLSVTSFVYGMTGKTHTLTVADVYTPKVESALRLLAQNTAKYGVVTEDLVEVMAKQGPHYLHAIATYESEALGLNLERSKQLRFPIAFIFPSEGTFWGNHPYCILDKADWVTGEQAEAAALFRDYLLTQEQQTLAIDSLLRPLDSSIPLRTPLTLENGTDPRVNLNTIAPLATPSAEVSTAIIDLFLLTKRKATIILVLDISGSMEGEKIRSATMATAAFLRRLQPDDKVGILTFNGEVSTLSEVVRVGDVVEELPKRVQTILAGGSTALYEAICQAENLAEQMRQADLAVKENRLYGIVLLSDGEDTAGHPTVNQMFATCLPASAEVEDAKIFPIAFGEQANTSLLNRVAEVTGGRLFTADPTSIDKIYLKISAEQ